MLCYRLIFIIVKYDIDFCFKKVIDRFVKCNNYFILQVILPV